MRDQAPHHRGPRAIARPPRPPPSKELTNARHDHPHEDGFTGNHVKHAKKPSGTDHLRCTFVAAGPPNCVSHAFGSSMLVVEGNPGKVVLGTGKYLGATGRVVSSREVAEAPPSSLAHNNIDVVARINLK